MAVSLKELIFMPIFWSNSKEMENFLSIVERSGYFSEVKKYQLESQCVGKKRIEK